MKHILFRSRLKILAIPLISAMSFSANALEIKECDKAHPLQKDHDHSLKEEELERGVDFLLGSLGEKDFEKGLKILEDLGRGGDGRAYTVLGKYFLNGENLQEGGLWFETGFRDCVDKVDFERAHTFFKKAAHLGDTEGKAFADKHPEVLLSKANQGDSLSQVLLGTGFLFGAAGFERNIREAVKWFEKARGDLSSCVSLGKIYRGVFDGFEGVDHKKAVEWFHKAEKMGSGDACFYLALHYANGDGVTQDRKKASYYADGARTYWIGGSLEILRALSNTPSDQRIENPRKDAVMVWRKPVPALGKGDRF